MKKEPFKNPQKNSQKLIAQIQKFPVRHHKQRGPALFDADGYSSRIARLIMHAYSAKSSEAKQLFYEKALRVINETKQSITQSNLPDTATLHLLDDLNSLEFELKKTITLLSLQP